MSKESDTIRREIGQLLSSGYVLTTNDFNEIYRQHGQSSSSNLLGEIRGGSFTVVTGINVGKVRLGREFGARMLYYDADLDVKKDTDLDDVLETLRNNSADNRK